MTLNFTFNSAALTHVGKVRKINEDSLIDRPEIGLWAVADGMGGHGGGDIASGAVVKSLAEMTAPTSASEFLHEFEDRIVGVNNKLQRIASERAAAVIGTTLVAILVFDAHFACVWCGDSRAYLMRSGELNQITRDHSEVQDLIDSGMLSRDEAKSWPGRNVVTRALAPGRAPSSMLFPTAPLKAIVSCCAAMAWLVTSATKRLPKNSNAARRARCAARWCRNFSSAAPATTCR